MFEVGKKVVSLSNFDDVRRIYGLNYPYRGDILVVRGIAKHYGHNFLLLYFDGIPIGLCHRNFAPLEEIGETTYNEITENFCANNFIIELN